MTGLLLTGLGILVLGLNLMMVWRTLTVTAASPTETISQLTRMGGGIMLAGFAILAIGVGTWIYGRRSQDGTAILSIGAAVVVLGGSSIIRAYGHGYEKMVWNGALIAVGIGVAIFLAYFIVIYLHNRR
jgi:uncharacterized membrane protein YidH (DUF202 family)